MRDGADEVIFHNGRFTTLDRSLPRAQAVLVREGRFAAVGDAAEIERQAAPGARRVDLGGRAAIPGLLVRSILRCHPSTADDFLGAAACACWI
jgi:predicted amidohydrolase YtcJ